MYGFDIVSATGEHEESHHLMPGTRLRFWRDLGPEEPTETLSTLIDGQPVEVPVESHKFETLGEVWVDAYQPEVRFSEEVVNAHEARNRRWDGDLDTFDRVCGDVYYALDVAHYVTMVDNGRVNPSDVQALLAAGILASRTLAKKDAASV